MNCKCCDKVFLSREALVAHEEAFDEKQLRKAIRRIDRNLGDIAKALKKNDVETE